MPKFWAVQGSILQKNRKISALAMIREIVSIWPNHGNNFSFCFMQRTLHFHKLSFFSIFCPEKNIFNRFHTGIEKYVDFAQEMGSNLGFTGKSINSVKVP